MVEINSVSAILQCYLNLCIQQQHYVHDNKAMFQQTISKRYMGSGLTLESYGTFGMWTGLFATRYDQRN